jgi:hypothetical protein
MKKYSGSCKEIWISLNDQEKEGTWEWSRRELNPDDYVNWLPSEPDNGARGEMDASMSVCMCNCVCVVCVCVLCVCVNAHIHTHTHEYT